VSGRREKRIRTLGMNETLRRGMVRKSNNVTEVRGLLKYRIWPKYCSTAV
jgi:hypothetical protein